MMTRPAVALCWLVGHALATSCGDDSSCEASAPMPSTQDLDEQSLLQVKSRAPRGAPDDAEPRSDIEEKVKEMVKEANEKAEREAREYRDLKIDHAVYDRALPGKLPSGPDPSTDVPPTNIERVSTFHGDCDLGTGLAWVKYWPDDDVHLAVTVESRSVRWAKFNKTVKTVHFMCDGAHGSKQTTVRATASQWVSLEVRYNPAKTADVEPSSSVKWNVWDPTDYLASIPFTSGTEGYACFKIPAMLRTQKGTFIAFSEARKPDCSDFARTDLVYKRSTDGGRTWSALRTLVKVTDEESHDQGLCGFPLVVGNMAPVQLQDRHGHHGGRILAPYTRNNYEAWITYSDDDGETWVGDRKIPNAQKVAPQPDCDRNMTYLGFDIDRLDICAASSFFEFVQFLCKNHDPYEVLKDTLKGPWQWVGAGPPGSLQLENGDVVVPLYHSYIRGIEGEGKLPISQLYNNFALGHTLISSNGGDDWVMSDDWEMGNGANENQMVQLSDGTVLTNSRALATGSTQKRLQARSSDGGRSFSASEFIEIPQPFNGCQGSTVNRDDNKDTVYVANPDPKPAKSVIQRVANLVGCGGQFTGRERVSVWTSTDGGATYPKKTLIDPGLSAQTSLQFADGKLYMLYEQADPEPRTAANIALDLLIENMKILLPSRFIFREVAV